MPMPARFPAASNAACMPAVSSGLNSASCMWYCDVPAVVLVAAVGFCDRSNGVMAAAAMFAGSWVPANDGREVMSEEKTG